MDASSVSFFGAFLGGLVSFLAPCVLPLIPGYLTFITGLSAGELREHEEGRTAQVLVPSILFALGFSIVFILLGGAVGFASDSLGPFMAEYKETIARIAGVVVVLIGVFMLGIIKLPWLYGEARFEMSKARRFGRAASFVMGMAFGFGWSPCVGPILAVILGMAAQTGDPLRAALMLATYSLGLAVPFVLTAVFFGRLTRTLRWFNKHALVINRVAGALLVVMGVLIFFDLLGDVSATLLKVFPFLREVG